MIQSSPFVHNTHFRSLNALEILKCLFSRNFHSQKNRHTSYVIIVFHNSVFPKPLSTKRMQALSTEKESDLGRNSQSDAHRSHWKKKSFPYTLSLSSTCTNRPKDCSPPAETSFTALPSSCTPVRPRKESVTNTITDTRSTDTQSTDRTCKYRSGTIQFGGGSEVQSTIGKKEVGQRCNAMHLWPPKNNQN
jgi:hypothetical protein